MEPTVTNIAIFEAINNTAFVSGAIDFDNVVLLWQQGVAWINSLKEVKEIKVDLNGLKQSDSSGLALLTGWVRASQNKSKSIVFMNVPNFMQDVLKVCGLEGVLPVLWEN